jgi:rhodanese-related sulfurtransferase
MEGPARITAKEVKEKLDKGEPMLIIDTRESQVWKQSDVKLPGAIRIPADDVGEHLYELPRDRLIVTYCT